MRKKVLLCGLLLLCSPVRGDERSALQLSELESRGQLLCASAMLYFNPGERTPDPRLLTSVFHHLQTLETYILQLGQPAALAQPLGEMKKVFAELDGLPTEQRQRYPELVQQLLTRQRQLQQAAASAYTDERQSLAADSPALLIGELSRSLAGFLLDYQLRHYPLPGQERFVLSPPALQALDQAIEGRFADLQSRQTGHAAELGKIRSSYQFVRGQIQQGGKRGHGGAEFYLSRAVTDLDELAQAVAQGSR